MAQPNAIVVGSGPNGLTAAIELARAGWSVTVLEAAATPGGGARTAELTLPGYHHDICSAIHPLAASSPVFRTLPLERHGLAWLHPDLPMAHPFDDGSAAVLARSFADTGATLGSRADADTWLRLLSPLADRWDDLVFDALAPLSLPRAPGLMLRFARHALGSASGLAARRFDDDRTRALVAGLAAHSVLPLERRPSAAFSLVLAAAGHAVGWPIARGGSQAITDALVATLEESGGQVQTGTRITSIDDLPDDGVVLLDLTPRQVVALAGHRLPRRYVRSLMRYRYGPGAFKVDWALSDPVPWRAEACRRAGTVHLGGSLEEIAASERDAWQGRLPDRPFVLVAQQSLVDATRAPAGRHTLWAYCHVPHGCDVDRTEVVERQIERFAPGFRDCILARHTMAPPAMETHNANLVGGDINGGAQDLRQLIARPVLSLNPYATPLRRVFLCSASSPPGGGVHGLCGHYAARSVLRRFA